MTKWDELTFNQKRHRIYRVVVSRTLFFWRVCGKDRQRFYKQIDFLSADIEDVRCSLINEYMDKVRTIPVRDYEKKVRVLKTLLG